VCKRRLHSCPGKPLFLWVYLYYSGEVDYLAIKRGLTIEVNGTVVRGEVLEGRMTAIVTTRDGGKEHSYKLFFAGDTDMTGNMGFVADCHRWVSPHFPFLLETRHYPRCKSLRVDRKLIGASDNLSRCCTISSDVGVT